MIITNIYFKLDKLKTLVKTLEAKQQSGVAIDIASGGDIKEFTQDDGKVIQQNASAWVSQSKEEREVYKQRFYVANGRVVWSSGEAVTPIQLYKPDESSAEVTPPTDNTTEDDLPF